MGAYATVGRWMPPVLGIALDELVRCAQQQMLAH